MRIFKTLIYLLAAAVFLELSSYGVLEIMKRTGSEVGENELFETGLLRTFFFRSSRSQISPANEWLYFRLPPVHPLPTKKNSLNEQRHEALLINKYRRVKLNDNIEDEEPADPESYRIVLTGNSTCMGAGVKKNSQTIAALLQGMLRERFGPKIQVLNYCVPDNKFSDEIVNFALHLRFLQPKIWISMNGDNDFSARNTSSSTDVMYLVGRRMFSGQMLFNSRPFFYNFQSLFKVFSMQSEISRIQKDLIDSIEPGFTQKDVSIYLGQLKNALSLAHGAGIKFVHILQPVMQLDTHRVTVEEKENLEIAIGKQGEQKKQFSIFLGNQRFYSEVRPELIKLGKDKTLPIPYHFHDFQNVFERAKDQTVYSDSRHYNELGQKLVAERIFSILNSLMEGP